METLMKRRQFSLEANCLEVWTWGSWKSRHQNVSSSCLQLATKHVGEDSLLAQSEAAVTQKAQQCWESQVQGTQTSLWSRCTIMCPVCMPPIAWSCGTYKWVTARCKLEMGLVMASIWWELSQMPMCLLCLSFSQGISSWYSSPRHLEIKIIL